MPTSPLTSSWWVLVPADWSRPWRRTRRAASRWCWKRPTASLGSPRSRSDVARTRWRRPVDWAAIDETRARQGSDRLAIITVVVAHCPDVIAPSTVRIWPLT